MQIQILFRMAWVYMTVALIFGFDCRIFTLFVTEFGLNCQIIFCFKFESPYRGYMQELVFLLVVNLVKLSSVAFYALFYQIFVPVYVDMEVLVQLKDTLENPRLFLHSL
jgi:hypothetical protein